MSFSSVARGAFAAALLASFAAGAAPTPKPPPAVTNAKVRKHRFLQPLAGDTYYPPGMVDQGRRLLLELAVRLEQEKPAGRAAYKLTRATASAFNQLEREFDGDIDTVMREAIAADIEFLLKAYGYRLDIEEAIGTRDW